MAGVLLRSQKVGGNKNVASSQIRMAKISISLPDNLLAYIDSKVENPSALIESLLQQWQQQQEKQALAEACKIVDELNLGWDEEWQIQAITDWEASGLSDSIPQ